VRSRANYFETHVFGAFNIDVSNIQVEVGALLARGGSVALEALTRIADGNAQTMLKYRETYDYICCIYDDGG
jgi:hypothetical protein